MARWAQIESEAPEFARVMRARLDAITHKTLATLRADGSPRISGIECFIAAGDIWFGSMPNARKAIDLRRDPRFALHSGSVDPPAWEGDAKLSGRVEEVSDPERRLALFRTRGADPPSPESHLFRGELEDAVLIGLNDARDRLVVEFWREGCGLRRIERK